MKKPRACELCKGEPSLYCESDSAFLCWPCDARVHGANFLAARHLRRPICSVCRRLDDRRPLSGNPPPSSRPVCLSCDSDPEPSSSSSSSARSAASSASSCVSSAEPASRSAAAAVSSRLRSGRGIAAAGRKGGSGARDIDARLEGVLASWCHRVGVDSNCAAVAASHALAVGMRKLPSALPLQVASAGAVLFAVKLCGGGGQGRAAMAGWVRKLEACSGVPARAIVLAEAKLARVVRSRHVDTEGWAECS